MNSPKWIVTDLIKDDKIVIISTETKLESIHEHNIFGTKVTTKIKGKICSFDDK